MYWLGVLLLIVVYALGFSFLGASAGLLNLSSLFIILIIVFPLLIFSGQLNYFLMGIKIAAGKIKKAPSGEIKKVIIAVKLTIRLIIVAGLIGFLVGAISILSTAASIQRIGGAIGLSVISILYSLFGIAFLIPVQARAEAFLIDISKTPIDTEEMFGDENE